MRSERAQVLNRKAADRDLLIHAAESERRFNTVFDSFVVFSSGTLAALQRRNEKIEFSTDVVQPSVDHKSLAVLTRVANLSQPSSADRQAYLGALLDAYRSLPYGVDASGQTLTIAPKREGMILGRSLGWLPSDALTPQMKRIPWRGGLAVGVADFDVPPGDHKAFCVIDGAVASGATTMALMELLHRNGSTFVLYTVHATQQGMNALLRYGELLQTPIRINAAFVSGQLNGKYYAIDQTEPTKLVVGDLGDTIAPLLGA